ncbi:MAG: Uma2 family endonuclease [Isosphaeraceae bacterium]
MSEAVDWLAKPDRSWYDEVVVDPRELSRDRFMSTVQSSTNARPKEWTVADLQRRFGPIPFQRIRQNPAPGTATEDDVLWLNDHEDRLYELVDGILVEKTVGLEESWLAVRIAGLINLHVEPRNLGIATGADGMYRLAGGLIRIPDVAFASWDRIPGGEFPEEPIPDVIPDLVVEVISKSNARKEMDEKLTDYFQKGVRLVWLVRLPSRVVDVYTAVDQFTRLTASSTLDGGDVLPGFSILVADLFRKPKRPGPQKPNGKQQER